MILETMMRSLVCGELLTGLSPPRTLNKHKRKRNANRNKDKKGNFALDEIYPIRGQRQTAEWAPSSNLAMAAISLTIAAGALLPQWGSYLLHALFLQKLPTLLWYVVSCKSVCNCRKTSSLWAQSSSCTTTNSGGTASAERQQSCCQDKTCYALDIRVSD